MAGKVKEIIDLIIVERSKGNPALVNLIRTKMIMKGIKIDKYDINSEDDQIIIDKLKDIAKELNIEITSKT